MNVVFRMALADGQRNFRSHYYEKVSLKGNDYIASNFSVQVGFRGVEEKKSLDLLLGEKPVDLARVQNFCLRFPLPSIYRIQVSQPFIRQSAYMIFIQVGFHKMVQ